MAALSAADQGDAPTESKKRPQSDPGLNDAPDGKRQRILTLPLDELLQLFPLHSSEVVVRCGDRQAGGAGAGSSSLTVKAGELFEVVVTIKTCFGPIGAALSTLCEQMIKHITLLPENVVVRQGEPHFSPSTGAVSFPARIEKAGDIEVSAAIKIPSLNHLPPNLTRLQQGGSAPVAHTIGGQACATRVKVQPGVMQFQNVIAKKKGIPGESMEFERGEPIELILQLGTSDQFGNLFALPFSDHDAAAFVADLSLEGHVIHMNALVLGGAVPLRLVQPTCTEAGILVGVMDLQVLGAHQVRITCSSQVLDTTVKVISGIPHSLQLVGEGRPHVLRQWRWGCKAQLLNQHGYSAIDSSDVSEISVYLEDLVPSVGAGGASRSQGLEIKILETMGSIKGCSLADADTATMMKELEIFHVESSTPTCKGEYSLHAQFQVNGCDITRSLVCDPATIHLDFPLDPSFWSPQHLADSIRLGGLEVPGDVLKDKFGAVVSGKDLVDSRDAERLLGECLLHDKRFANRQEEDDAHTPLKQVAARLQEKHTLADLGKGKFKSLVATCISESDLSVEAEPFDKGGSSDIFRGNFEGRSVAVKVPIFRERRGLKVDDDTKDMMKQVEREITVTKACSHPHVVQVLGLMVGPGRIGIVMEHCDTSLAKHILDPVAMQTFSWAESVRHLMDGAAGLSFIHTHKGTTHGDVKPDNLLIQQGKLKVSDFGLATVRRTMTKFTGMTTIKGTSSFMAPEMLLGEPGGAQPAIDVWGFGCCIANVVTGELPFATFKSEHNLQVAMRQKTPVYCKKQVRAGSPKKLLDLIDKCCDYNASNRPSMMVVEQELRSILESIQTRDGFGLPPPWLERGCCIHDSGWKMFECAVGTKDFELIKTRLESEMGDCVTILKIEMNVNIDLFRRYHLERDRVLQENLKDANEAFLWHATKEEGTILQQGFDTNYCRLDFEYYGAGLYLAADSKMSNAYTTSSRHSQYPSDRSMLLCRVACGKMAERPPLSSSSEYQKLLLQQAPLQLSKEERKRQSQDKIRELLRMPENRTCSPGFHSQLGVDMPNARKSKTEIVVNRSYQAFPAYRISYRLSRALPSPVAEGRRDLRTFDDYKSSDFHRQAVSDRLL